MAFLPWPAKRYLSERDTTVIGNLGDGSTTVTPELTYTGIDNVEVRLRLQFNLGGALTEYGERAVSNRAELRIRVFF